MLTNHIIPWRAFVAAAITINQQTKLPFALAFAPHRAVHSPRAAISTSAAAAAAVIRRPPQPPSSTSTVALHGSAQSDENMKLVELHDELRHRAPIASAFEPPWSTINVGRVTAGNASGINDGAAVLLLMSAASAADLGLQPLATVVSGSSAGVEPRIMGTGPIPAATRALERAGWTISDLDLVEANEAFAAQAISVNRGLGWDQDKVNVNGGAIALGHPIGASGTRILVTLLNAMRHQGAATGLATLCLGGGNAVALSVEKA